MLIEIHPLAGVFFRDFIRDGGACPDLAMRMRIASAHHGAAILKNLDVSNRRKSRELAVLFAPRIYKLRDSCLVHLRYGKIVTRRKTYYPADACLATRDQQIAIVQERDRSFRQQRWIVVIEHERGFVIRISNSPNSFITRAQVAVRVVRQLRRVGCFFNLSSPRTQSAVRGYNHPFSREAIQTPMRTTHPIGSHRAVSSRAPSAVSQT